MTEPDGLYRLELPPEPGSVSVARLFVATVMRVVGGSEELVGDVKLAISELVTEAVTAGNEQWVDVRIEVDGGRIEVSVGPIRVAGQTERIDVATALFPSTTIDADRAGFSIDPARQ